MNSIIIKPLVTEKMTADTEKNNRYGFIVNKDSNKIEIKGAVEEMYGVTVEKVRTMRYSGKSSSRFTKTGVVKGKKRDYKKAIIS